MKRHLFARSSCAIVLTVTAASLAAAVPYAGTALSIDKAQITIAGTSNIHDYTATTADAKVTNVQVGSQVAGPAFWDEVQKPGGLVAFDLAIKAESLKSNKDGLDKNMYKALKTKEHPVITFSLKRMEGAPGALKAVGVLQVAGVEREVTLPLTTIRKGEALGVAGRIDVLMTDHGITPPKAMMGMVKADPKIIVSFDILLAVAATN